MWPLLFALTIWPTKKMIKAKFQNLPHHSWYLDDRIITGKDHALVQTIAILCEEGHERSLVLHRDKCDIWSSSELLISDKQNKTVAND